MKAFVSYVTQNSLTHTHSDIDGVLRRANATDYGLASGLFTRDISKVQPKDILCGHIDQFLFIVQALRVSDGLQAGTVFVNTYNKTDVAAPFGGFKQSGFGKDLGKFSKLCPTCLIVIIIDTLVRTCHLRYALEIL